MISHKIVKIRKSIRRQVGNELDNYIDKVIRANHSIYDLKCLERAEKLYEIVKSGIWAYCGIFF